MTFKAAAWVCLSAVPVVALADGPPDCGFAQSYCECSAVFAVLETEDDDTAFEAMLRRKSQALRAQVQMFHGSRAGDQMVDSHIAALLKEENDLQGAVDLAHLLARCDRFITRSDTMPEVVFEP